jgi:hypothetical protein
VLPCGKFTRKLLYAVDRRVHLTADFPLSSLQGGDNATEGDVAHYHYIDIAALRFVSFRNRTVNEGDPNPPSLRAQRFLQDLSNAEGFADKAMELVIRRALPVYAVIGLPPLHHPAENPRSRKLFQFPLNSAGSTAYDLNDLAQIKAFVRMRKEVSKNSLSRGSEERRGKGLELIERL